MNNRQLPQLSASGTTRTNQQPIQQESVREFFNRMVSVELTNTGLKATYFKPPVPNQLQSTSQSNNSSSYLNEVYTLNKQTPITTGVTAGIDSEIRASIPLFLKGGNSIRIPTKVERAICKYVSKPLLKTIHSDINIAVELCLLFLSNLSDTYFRVNGIGFNPNDYEKKGWKNLSSSILRQQLSDNPDTYKNIVECLESGTREGPIIECDYIYISGVKSYSYRLAEHYRCKGIVKYKLKTDYVKRIQNKNFYNRIAEAMNNPIAKNLLRFYHSVQLPRLEEIEAEATRLIKLKYKTKKGKRLTRIGKKKRTYWKNPDERSFVEESIKIFNYLTEEGLMVPTAGGDKSGGRVVDSFTLMPSWIRNLIKINGQPIVEADYSALHPNIAMKEYGGSMKFLTHQQVADELKLDLLVVKREHLSFFNKRYSDMKKSPVFDFYNRSEQQMLLNIEEDKALSYFGHKATSRRLFRKEVEIMTEVVENLNKRGIYVGYIYDALFCEPSQKQIVEDEMNKVILKHGVSTVAK